MTGEAIQSTAELTLELNERVERLEKETSACLGAIVEIRKALEVIRDAMHLRSKRTRFVPK